MRSRRGVAPPPARPPVPASIAVLPFADLSPDQDQGYFCDGIADELLTALSCVPGLRVAARSSSFQFKGRSVDGREVGRSLGVATLLEGGVRKAGNRVRVSAQLVNGADGYQLWSETFDRNVDDIFAIQEEIAQAVVRALRPHLGGAGEGRLTRAGTQSTPAYEMYLRGRQFLMSLSENGYRFARQMFKGAIELDPAFAQAHAGLADTDYFILQWHLDDANADTLRAEALAASGEALRLDPDLAEAHVSRANVFSYSGRAEEAEVEFRRALSLNPALPHAHYFYARHLFGEGRLDEAAREFEETMRLDPDDYGTAALLVTAHKGRGNLDAAAAAAAADAQGCGPSPPAQPRRRPGPLHGRRGRDPVRGPGPGHGAPQPGPASSHRTISRRSTTSPAATRTRASSSWPSTPWSAPSGPAAAPGSGSSTTATSTPCAARPDSGRSCRA